MVVRFDYGATVPWVTRTEDGTIDAIAGPERMILRTPATLHGEDLKTVGEFTVGAGQSVPFVLSTGGHLQVYPRRSIPSRRWSAQKPSGANGAIDVRELGLGLARSSGRSSH